jgi:hypothetical protein
LLLSDVGQIIKQIIYPIPINFGLAV